MGTLSAEFCERQLEVLERVVQGEALPELLERIVRLIEEQSSGTTCCLLLVDLATATIRHVAAPGLPVAYVRALNGSRIDPDAGVRQAAAHLAERIVVEDIGVHPLWRGQRELTQSRGIRAGWSSPIFDRKRRVLGTFAMLYREARPPTAVESEWVAAAVHLAEVALESARAERERKQLLWQLDERVKELTLLHQTARLLQSELPFEALLSGLLTLIPPAWQYPELCRVRIRWQALQLESPGYRPSPHRIERSFGALNEHGQIEVAYLEDPRLGHEPFLAEELELSNSLAEMLSAHVGRQQRRRLESQLQQTQRLQALGTLAGGIAHDFNNILTAISGNVELGLLALTPDHEAHESLTEIRKATRRAADLVRQVLAFSRQDPPVRRALDVRGPIEEVLRMLRATVPADIRLEQDVAADAPAVSADANQLHQVLMNLCTNAVHALQGRSGVIRVSASSVEVSPEWVARHPELHEGHHCRIVVSDDGCGMDSATLARAFEPFFTTHPQGQRVGLGLSVAHGILRSHGGSIHVQSEIGKGTTVELYLPAASAAAASAPAPPPVVSKATGQHILYVDDDEALVFLAQRLLPRKGYRVTGHIEAAAALSDFRARPREFDLVVTDISMPGMSGAELVGELRRLRPELPIVMTSGHIRAEDREVARELGVNELILKPESVDELARVLHQTLAALRQHE